MNELIRCGWSKVKGQGHIGLSSVTFSGSPYFRNAWRESQYRRVFFRDGTMEHELDRRFGHRTILVKKDLNRKVKVSIYQSNPHLWSRAVGSDPNYKMVDTSGRNECPPYGGCARIRATTPLVVLAFDPDLSWTPPFGGSLETLGQTQNPLRGLYISSGLGMPRDNLEDVWNTRMPPRLDPG